MYNKNSLSLVMGLSQTETRTKDFLVFLELKKNMSCPYHKAYKNET